MSPRHMWRVSLLIMFLLAGCWQGYGGKRDTPVALTRNYPRVDGSTSTWPLQTALACQILQVPCVWRNSYDYSHRIVPDPDYTSVPDTVARIRDIQHTGTHAAYVNLIEDQTDLILVARLPSAQELAAAAESGVTFDVRAVALDAFVFLVNTQNPVDNLELEDVRTIYSGKVTDWADLGGTPGTIRAFQRNPNSGSQELMETMVMQGLPIADLESSPGLMIIDMGGLLNQVAYMSNGIGYSIYYYVVYMLPQAGVKLLSIDGVAPTAETIAARSYTLTTEVYAVVREGLPATAPAVTLRDWLLTDAGQTAVAASGYVPLR
jgi:phosphate transport system substrate-binding protein